MGCIGYKWIFGIIGSQIAGSRGFWIGFLFGWLLDSMYGRKTIHFTYRTYNPQDESSYQRTYQTYHPRVDTRLQEAYNTLGISETATDDEVRQAYRKLALMYHPDRVASKGEQERLAAERIFKQISEARDIIFKARGL